MYNGGKNSLKSPGSICFNIPNLLRDLATADLINNWKYQLHRLNTCMQQCFQNMQSYEKLLHTTEPLIAHLLNPNYLQVMIRWEYFDWMFWQNPLVLCPPDDLIPEYWAAVRGTHA